MPIGRHVPVLLNEVVAYLDPQPNENVIDLTVGSGGHASAILEKTSPNGKLLGIDRDAEALTDAKQTLQPFHNRILLKQTSYEHFPSILNEHPAVHPISRILLDLGLSSRQLENDKRGFSFQNPDSPLDMRFDAGESTPTAADLINTSTSDQLARILEEYGQEPFARAIAQAIAQKRSVQLFQTTGQLAEVVLLVYRERLKSKREVPWVGGRHPATKTFQALRIAVNKELERLRAVLPLAVMALRPGGRIAVISFHSLEDTIIKHFFREQARSSKPTLRIITKKVIQPTFEERKTNPRSRSAHLRVAEKI